VELREFDPVCEAVLERTDIGGPTYPVIDFHTHMGKLLLGKDYAQKYDTHAYRDALRRWGVVRAVNLDGFYGADLERMNEKIGDCTGSFVNFMWIDFDGFEDSSFAQKTRKLMQDAYQKGCLGVKLWKNISLYMRDEKGRPIRTDDSRMDVVYETAALLGIPVLMHVADPVAFFKPVDARNERYEELEENPEWNFSDRDTYMSFEALLEMQENTVKNHPDTTFVIAHVGSYGENLGWVGTQLDRYPNLYVDIAARLAEVGRVPYSARKFFTRYQDRIVFGTDTTPLTLGIHKTYYRFLETEDEYFPYQPEGEKPGQGRWAIYGIYLDDETLKKVYYKNACKLLHWDVGQVEEEFHEKVFER